MFYLFIYLCTYNNNFAILIQYLAFSCKVQLENSTLQYANTLNCCLPTWPFMKSALTFFKCVVLLCSEQHCENTWARWYLVIYISSMTVGYFIYFLSALHTLHWERRERPQATGARRLHTCLLQAPPAASLQHLRSGERKKRGHVRGPLRRANVERSRNSGGLLWLLTFIYLFKMASVRGNLCLAFTSGAVSQLRVSLKGDTTEVLMSFTWTMI